MSTSTTTLTPSESPSRKWTALVVLSLALAIIVIDTTLLNVSISTIIKDLHTNIQSIQWVISGYSLTLAALTITGGRFGDLFGRKKMFVLGAIIFAIGSFITSISHNITTMIMGEAIIEGIGAALMMPATSSLLISTFKGRERAIAFGVWGAIAAASAALGPVLGGYLATNYSWRWGFRINVFVAIALVIGSIIIHESRDTEEKQKIDWVGILLSSLGLLSFVFGIIEASTYGWWKAKALFVSYGHTLTFAGGLSIVPYAVVLGLIILTLFMVWENYTSKQGNTPLVSVTIFANRQFSSGILTTIVLALGQAGLFFALPVFLQSVTGLDAYHTGLALLPLPLALLIVAPLSAFMSHKFAPKSIIQTGMAIGVIAYLILWKTINVDSTSLTLAPSLILYGIGMGMVFSQITNITLSAVSVQEAGEASGINNTARQLGSTLGSAILGAVLLTSLSGHLTTGITNSTVIPNQMKQTIATAAAQQTSNIEFGGGEQTATKLPTYINQEIRRIGRTATTDANKDSLLYGALFSLLGLFVSFNLPKTKNVERNQSAAAGH